MQQSLKVFVMHHGGMRDLFKIARTAVWDRKLSTPLLSFPSRAQLILTLRGTLPYRGRWIP
jgi:hypothetical protein